MQSLHLFQNHKERFYFLFVVFFISVFNLSLEYNNFFNFTKNEVYNTDVKVINIYHKNSYDVLKLQNDDITFFTSIDKNSDIKQLDNLNIYIITSKINFYRYLKGFYTKSFGITKLKDKKTLQKSLYNYIGSQHKDQTLSSLYSALFLAIPVQSDLRDIFSTYGISHLIAISGFHLGVLSVVFYFLLNLIYKPIHQRYIPYRNKRFDIMVVVGFLLFLYMYLVQTPPSLLRAFVMFIFGFYLLRQNIKLVSFETLFIVVVTIVSLFPKLLFSLSLWFSVAGVFYIFLFLKYFSTVNRYLQLIFFNFWIYLAINPIVHHFFDTTSLIQLVSPILTILFTLFYPITLVLHIFGIGWVFDSALSFFINLDFNTTQAQTPLWLFVLYLLLSFGSIFSKKTFFVLNIFLICINITFLV